VIRFPTGAPCLRLAKLRALQRLLLARQETPGPSDGRRPFTHPHGLGRVFFPPTPDLFASLFPFEVFGFAIRSVFSQTGISARRYVTAFPPRFFCPFLEPALLFADFDERCFGRYSSRFFALVATSPRLACLAAKPPRDRGGGWL